MKKLIFLIIITFSFANETKEILELINILKEQKRITKPITYLYNPFIVKNLQKKHKTNTINYAPILNYSKKHYNLEVIFQNRVKINGKWYKNYSKIGKYIIIIKNGKVFLKSKKKVILLKRKMLLKVYR